MQAVHLKSPLTFNGKGVAGTVVQGTNGEIANCVLNIVSCIQGFREDSPEYGIPDETFTTVPLDPEALATAIGRWEPRAELTVTELEELGNPANRRMNVQVGG